MNIRLLAAVALWAAVGSPLVQAQPSADAEHQTELEGHMKKAGKAFRMLRASLKDPAQNDASLKLVATIRTELTAGLDLKPEKEADLPADQQADFQTKYLAKMKDYIAEVDKLADLIKAGDNAGAQAQFGKLGMEQRTDHKEFRKPHD